MLLLLPIGCAGILLATSCNAMLQLSSAPEMQGRVMALYTTVFVGSAPFGSLLVGWIGGGIGPRWALFAGGLICFVSVVGCALYYVRAQRLEIKVADHVWWPRTLADDELEDEALLADVRSR
jgi:MFS family permease